MLPLAFSLLASCGALSEQEQEQELVAVQAENQRLRAELEKHLQDLDTLIVQAKAAKEAARAEDEAPRDKGRPGPRRRLFAAGGSGATGKFLHDGMVHSFSDANTCLGTSGPLTVHNSASAPCGSNARAPPSDPVAPNGMCSLTRNCPPAAGDIVFERSRAEKVRVPPPITVHHAAACEANRPSTTVNLNVTMRGDFNIQGALVMADGLDVVAEIQNLMVPPSAPPVPPP